MNEMAKSKEGQAHEVRTAGGESSEIIRTPDINIALYASTEDLIRKEMTIMSYRVDYVTIPRCTYLC